MKLEVVTVPVSDVDRAKRFYQSLGWRLDVDFAAGDDVRLVQMTPPHSQCSIHFGKGLTTASRGPSTGCTWRSRTSTPPGTISSAAASRSARWRSSRPSGFLDLPGALVLRVRVVQRPGRQRLAAPGGHDPAPRPGMGGLTWTSPRWQICCTRRPCITTHSRRPPHRTTGGTGTRRTWTPARGEHPGRGLRGGRRYMAEVKHVVVG